MFLLLTLGCLADIRPDGLTDDEARGRAMLEAAAEAAGGLERWDAVEGSVVVMADTWPRPYGLFSPWPEAHQTVSMTSIHHSFDTRVDFLDGGKAGWSWGISDWETWEVKPGEAAGWAKNSDAAFILPTMHYFLELPFRVLEAPIARYAGPESIGGVAYERVFVTWESVSPNREFDQYVIYIDPDTERIAKVHYTVREISGFVTGTMHFGDMREVDGVWFSFDMVVTVAPDDALDDYLHRAVVESLTLGPVDEALFLR